VKLQYLLTAAGVNCNRIVNLLSLPLQQQLT